jgi:hypothetical protein
MSTHLPDTAAGSLDLPWPLLTKEGNIREAIRDHGAAERQKWLAIT